MSQVCQSGQGANAKARAIETESDDQGEEQCNEIRGAWTMSVCSSSVSQTREHDGDFLNMIMGSGAEEHVVSFPH